MLIAGSAQVNITPGLGEELAGYPHYPRHNTGAHDPLYAACVYCQQDGQEVALVTLDLLFFSKRHVAAVRQQAQAACGIPGANIMISCSHTHSGPWASGRLDIESLEAGRGEPEAYVNALKEKIVALIVEAKRTSFTAELCVGVAVCGAEQGVGGNRRFPGGPHDPLVSVVAIRDEKKTVRGVMVNYTLHPSFIHEWSTVCTADYPAYVRMQVAEYAPQAAMGFAQGASGNQSSRYYRNGESYDEAERVGRAIGAAACQVLENGSWEQSPVICAAHTELPVELRSFGTEEDLEEKVAQCKEKYEALYEKYGKSTVREEYYLWQNANLETLGAEDQLGYVKMQNRGMKISLLEDENPAEVQIIRLGEACLVGVPGEVFVEFGLYIKAMAGFGTVIFNTLTNGCLPGYLYTPESLVTGGYETDTSMLGEQFGGHLMSTILATIQDVK